MARRQQAKAAAQRAPGRRHSPARRHSSARRHSTASSASRSRSRSSSTRSSSSFSAHTASPIRSPRRANGRAARGRTPPPPAARRYRQMSPVVVAPRAVAAPVFRPRRRIPKRRSRSFTDAGGRRRNAMGQFTRLRF